ncbi:hypothetical protein BDW74DRAFT_173247 [Aspergillus multicolor]|uniref:uncharacterized protein n=1 Tax=Aspergillus multicolor TaxID=41759 RepID=UPI003CCCBA54
MDFEDADEVLYDLSRSLEQLRFPDNQLRSFRWEVGTCLPESIFHSDKSFLESQKRIQSLVLIADSGCRTDNDAHPPIDLVQFSELRPIEWKGLSRYTDFESLRARIQAHGHKIQSLTLDLLNWDRAEKTWSDGFQQHSTEEPYMGNFFADLSAVSFMHTGMSMLYAMNFTHLKTLTLRNCLGALPSLRTILDEARDQIPV